ncbi:penicillin amidase [Gemmatimonadetes bacterium T265]|nr:penicillin amidase [Gemmatimonadetes bacterium T265]
MPPASPARAAAAALLLGAGALAASRRVGPLPPLGPLLDPAHGVWAARPPSALGAHDTARVAGLGRGVRVVYDRRHVPHIFAATELDAYRALGYVVARDRLFQLTVQALASGGRLTELAGPAALPLDREMRRLGLPRAAEAKLRALPAAERALLDAYAAGVNAYVAAVVSGSVGAADLPIEFRLTNTRPLPWRAVDALHVMNRMGWTLAFEAREVDRAAAAARVGAQAAAALFPDREPIVEPIQPNGSGAPRDDFAPLPPPGAPDAGALRVAAAYDAFFPGRAGATPPDERPHLASNNWAVAPARSATAHALLAGDPHLDLTLPSIWYEAHLVVPGALDVYGVTIPGIPGVVIGFNRDVAWTFTNTGVDVVDFYAEEVDDPARPTRYRLDGAWVPLERRVEEYRTAAGALVAADTLLFTHRGPLRREPGAPNEPPRWLSMRWTVLEPGNELGAFREAAHATTARAFLDAMARGYRAPAQNMLAADRAGTIAIRSTGRFPVRPGDGSGDAVRDGRTRASDWTGDLPMDRYPQAFAPAQGYLASANQQPVDVRPPGSPNAGDFWGGGYDPWRALRINALLRADARVTVDAMRGFQSDPGSARADRFVPYFLRAAARGAPAGVDARTLADAAGLLGAWDRRYTLDNTRAVLFEWTMRELAARTWDELDPPGGRAVPGVDPFGRPGTRPPRAVTPSSAVLAELLADSASPWWDERATPTRETRDDVLAQSLAAALDSCRAKYGAPDSGGWTWRRLRHANIRHLGRVPTFGALDLPVPGGPNTLWPSAGEGTAGPSWRMVVELGDSVRAWGIYPGGQTGNPLDPGYRDRLPRWLAGELDALLVPRTPTALSAGDVAGTLTLVPR